MTQRRIELVLKRVFDIAVVSVALIVAAPILIAVAVLVKLSLGSPVLFRQLRPGLHGKSFALYKFRTMRSAVDSDGVPLPDSERLTRAGQLIRSTSLDELPELFNILRGDMSLVGPRPLLPEYLDRYSPEQSRRHEVRPGLTGWAQINGRNATSWPERLSLDVWYVDNWSLLLDVKILFRTAAVVFRRSGISHEGEVTMPPFLGQQNRTEP